MTKKNAEPQLAIEYVPIDTLTPYARNAKLHPPEQVAQIAASIEQFGNCDPIGVWANPETGAVEIVEGHGRYQALLSLGVETAPIIRLDHLSDEQRRAYTLAHNQTTLNSGWDELALAVELNDLEIDLQAFGFTSNDLVSEEELQAQEQATAVYEKMQLRPFEHHDYIVFLFDNVNDFMVACEHFKLKKVDAGWDEMVRIGLGRIVHGRKLIEELRH